MKVYVETNPETVYSGRVKDEVKTTEIRMWFETDEEIEVLPLADYTKQVRAESEADKKALICDYESRITKHQELMSWLEHNNDELKQQLEEKDKTIQSYEKILEQKDEEISFANRDKIYIVKQLHDPKDYVLLEDYKKVEQQLHDLSKKIVGEIKNELYDCGKTYLEDEPYIEICIVQGILDTILKKFGGKDE